MTDESIFGGAALVVPFAWLFEVDHGAVLASAAIVGLSLVPVLTRRQAAIGVSPFFLVSLKEKKPVIKFLNQFASESSVLQVVFGKPIVDVFVVNLPHRLRRSRELRASSRIWQAYR